MTTPKIVVNEHVFDLADGGTSLIEGIQTRFPNLSNTDVQILANTVMRKVGQHIASGERVAFVKMNPDNSVDLTILELRSLE